MIPKLNSKESGVIIGRLIKMIVFIKNKIAEKNIILILIIKVINERGVIENF